MALERLRKHIEQGKAKREIAQDLRNLNFSHGVPSVFSSVNPDLARYMGAMRQMDETIQKIKDKPEDIFLGRNIPKGMEYKQSEYRFHTPPHYTYGIQLHRGVQTEQTTVEAMKRHSIELACYRLGVPQEKVKDVLTQAKKTNAIQLTNRWELRFGGQYVMYPVLIPVEHPEYVQSWKRQHLEQVKQLVTPKNVMKAMIQRMAHEYLAKYAGLRNSSADRFVSQFDVFDLGTFEDVEEALHQAGWEKITDEKLHKELRKASMIPEEIYRHKRAQPTDPYLSVAHNDFRFNNSNETVHFIAVPSKAMEANIRNSVRSQAKKKMGELIDAELAKRSQETNLSPIKLVRKALTEIGQEIADYDQRAEHRILARLAAEMLVVKLKKYPKLAERVAAIEDLLRKSAKQDIGWHPDAMPFTVTRQEL